MEAEKATEHVKQWGWEPTASFAGSRLSQTQHPAHNTINTSFLLPSLLTHSLHSWKLQFLTQSEVEAVTQKRELLWKQMRYRVQKLTQRTIKSSRENQKPSSFHNDFMEEQGDLRT